MKNTALSGLLEQPSWVVAPQLLGCVLERSIEKTVVRVRIVEVEAYDQTDAASHSYSGRTPRNDVMFGPPGHLYVYFTYGMYYCCNIVTGQEGTGSAVLIRAVEPLGGRDVMERLRQRSGYDLSNGPAKLCQALGINRLMNGHDLSTAPLKLLMQPPLEPGSITQATRIGISSAQDVTWRFYITGNPYVSRL